jgi:uncharacterized protein (DUF608 family)
MEGMQHNTYDIEYYGPNTMMGSLYLGALRAGERMARQVGDEAAAAEYARLAESGARWTDEHLFNGEYFEQDVRPEAWRAWPEPWQQRSIGRYGYDSRFTDWPKWQVGAGCLSDQLLGGWYAEMLGLGSLYNPEHVRSALAAIWVHNFRDDLTDHPNPMRIYAVGEEAGLIICTWPRGNRPGHPSVYGDECWSGIEYQVAAHLIYAGLVDEGLSIVKAVRGRYTGERRNPWNEIECGHHYARSMASYSLLLALSGFRYRGADGALWLDPRLDEGDFRVFFSVGSGWGLAGLRRAGGGAEVTVEVRHGSLKVGQVVLPASLGGGTPSAELAGHSLGVTATVDGESRVLALATPVEVTEGQVLVVRA